MKYGIPYMGSKSDIIASIALNLPRAEHFYDLFGGGFCVSHYMRAKKSHWYKHIHYNEIKSDVVDLVKKAIAGEFSYNKFKPAWISRDEFYARKASDAYVRCLWSFGNNQRDYLFNPDIEPYKRSAHMAVVFDKFDDTSFKVLGFSEWPKNVRTIKQKRFYWRQKVRFENKGRDTNQLKQLQQLQQLERLQQLQQLEQLERLQRLEQLQQLEQLERLERLEQLERLQQLERLEQLEQLEQLSFTARDYRDVKILPNSVVYCDIPYKSTADYIDGFDHSAFYDWALSREFPVYISEYSMPREFKTVYTIQRKTRMSSKGMTSHHDEKLFWNGKH